MSRWRPIRTWGLTAALGFWLVAAVGLAQPASAAFPGADGLIATDDSDGACTGSCVDAGGPGNRVFTVNPRNHRVSAVTSSSVSAQAYAAKWSPSGRLLAFVQFAFPMDAQVLAVSGPTGAGLTLVPLPVGLGTPSDPAFADNTHLLFVATHGRRYDIYRVALDGSGLRSLAHLVGHGGLATPAESSRGRIAFVSGESIYLLDHAGQPKLLHAGINPDFSPGGTRIVFEDPRHRLIDTIGLDGRGLRRLMRLPRADACGVRQPGARPVYSPSGKYVVLTRFGDCGRPPAALLMIRANGTHARVVRTGDPVQDPSWQPRLRSVR